MNRLMGVFIGCICFLHSACLAEMTQPYASSSARLHTDLFTPSAAQDKISGPDHFGISCGFFNVEIYAGAIPEVKIVHPAPASFSLISTAEASNLPDGLMVGDLERIVNTVSIAGRIDDLKPVLTARNIEVLKLRVRPGVSQQTVLGLLQAIRPQKIRILDFDFKEGSAEFKAAGHSFQGPVEGLIHMLKEDGVWKIEDEIWYAGMLSEPKVSAFVRVASRFSDAGGPVGLRARGHIAGLSSNDVVQKKLLRLNKVSTKRQKKAFMFVFLMDKKTGAADMAADKQERSRMRMHVLGPKKVFAKQKLTEDKYPIDLSTARYDDGFAPQEWNLVLPSGKPQAVAVSWLWSF